VFTGWCLTGGALGVGAVPTGGGCGGGGHRVSVEGVVLSMIGPGQFTVVTAAGRDRHRTPRVGKTSAGCRVKARLCDRIIRYVQG
jgi:hypothetical protein